MLAQDRRERSSPGSARVARSDRLELLLPAQPEALGLIDRAFQLPTGKQRREVEQRAGRRRDRDPKSGRGLLLVQCRNPMHDQASATSNSPLGGNRDMDARVPIWCSP